MSSRSRYIVFGQAAACMLLLAAAFRFAGGAPAAIPQDLDTPGALAGGRFPRIARDAHGDRIRLERPPERLGSQAVATDEFLFAIAPSDRIVAVSSFAGDPRYSNVADLVNGMDFAFAEDPEAIALRSPDLMLVSHTARADYVDLVRAIGVPVFRMITIFEDFEQIAAALQATGYLTGEDEAAEREVARLRGRIRAARQLRAAGADPVRILAYSNFAQTLGAGSLFDRIVTNLGGINVAAEQGVGLYGSITSEQVAAWNPDWIVAGVESGLGESTRERLLADPGVAVTRAGQLEQLLLIENRWYLSMSHHAVMVMEAIAAALNSGTE